MDLEFLELAKSEGSYWNAKAVLFPEQQSASSILPTAEQIVDAFVGVFRNSDWRAPLPVAINASRLDMNGAAVHRMGISASEAQQYFAAGFSLCFGDLSQHIESVGALRSSAATILGYPETILVTGYLSPPNSIGVLHYDTQHNFFIQREGVKRWFVSDRAAVKNPHQNFIYNGATLAFFDEMKEKGYEISLPNECGRTEYNLHPGDVLYVPPGFYHSPETFDEHSLHYTLTVDPACFWTAIQKHMYEKLLRSGGDLYRDCRFDDKDEVRKFYNSCFEYIARDF